MNKDHEEEAVALSPVEEVAATVLLLEPAFLAEGPARERFAAVAALLLVVAFFLFECLLWGVTLAGFGVVLPAAVLIAVLIAFIIAAFDVKLCAGDIAPRGILSPERGANGHWRMLAARIGIAVVFGHATSTGVTLAIFHDEAIQEVAQVIDAKNRPIVDEYDRKIAGVRAEEEGRLVALINGINEQRRAAAAQATTAVRDADEALRSRDEAELEVNRQIGGRFGRAHGDGPLAEDARDQSRMAERRASDLRSDAATARAEIERLGHEQADAENRLATEKPRIEREVNRLVAERDGKLRKHTTGPLTVFEGVFLLERDPQTAGALNLVLLTLYPFLMTFELIICLTGIVFKPANEHDVAATLDLQTRAAQRIHHYARALQDLRAETGVGLLAPSFSVEEVH